MTIFARFRLTRPATTVAATTGAESNSISGTNKSGLAQGPTFSPRLIFSQIVALQSLHYLCLSIIIQINHSIFGTTVTVDRIFTAHYLNLWKTSGWIDNAAVICSHVIGAYLLMLIVEKSRKCLDFATTLFFIHFLFCCCYNGFPASWDWWIVHLLGTLIMTVLGEYLCSRRELEEIPLL
jgi:hypothetical protein